MVQSCMFISKKFYSSLQSQGICHHTIFFLYRGKWKIEHRIKNWLFTRLHPWCGMQFYSDNKKRVIRNVVRKHFEIHCITTTQNQKRYVISNFFNSKMYESFQSVEAFSMVVIDSLTEPQFRITGLLMLQNLLRNQNRNGSLLQDIEKHKIFVM